MLFAARLPSDPEFRHDPILHIQRRVSGNSGSPRTSHSNAGPRSSQARCSSTPAVTEARLSRVFFALSHFGSVLAAVLKDGKLLEVNAFWIVRGPVFSYIDTYNHTYAQSYIHTYMHAYMHAYNVAYRKKYSI